MRSTLPLTGNDLTIKDFAKVVYDGMAVRLSPSAKRQMEQSHRLVEQLACLHQPVYGVNTGFGKLSDVPISPAEIEALQLNLVRSHACGVGPPLSEAETRGIMLCRANVLAKGYCGCRPEVATQLIGLLNHKVHPVIPSQGSVGASGDLAPLAHLALVLGGEGVARVGSRRVKGREALRQVRLKPLKLGPKEGISLLNGTQAMLSLGILSLLSAETLVNTADAATALSLDALKGTPVAYDEKIHALRPFPGQIATAANLRRLSAGSEIRESHRGCRKIQDAYSLRCAPQVHGSVRETLAFTRRTFEIELNAATDNPLVFPREKEILSGGNFHGQPLAMALDFMAIALTELGSISERRIERLINPEYGDLPPFLASDPGVHSGFMMLQVTAAALTSECKVLAHPASVDSIPTSGNKEDHVSMGMGAALKLRQVMQNVRRILAIELLCGAQGIEFLAPLKPGPGVQKVYRLIREVSATVRKDRSLANDIEAVSRRIEEGAFARILDHLP
ncbi:MAG: histidine ammonia-lyase [Terriglobia bacterium]